MRDPDSIRAWLEVRPDQHLRILRALWRLRPQYREAIEAAVAMARARAST